MKKECKNIVNSTENFLIFPPKRADHVFIRCFLWAMFTVGVIRNVYYCEWYLFGDSAHAYQYQTKTQDINTCIKLFVR